MEILRGSTTFEACDAQPTLQFIIGFPLCCCETGPLCSLFPPCMISWYEINPHFCQRIFTLPMSDPVAEDHHTPQASSYATPSAILSYGLSGPPRFEP